MKKIKIMWVIMGLLTVVSCSSKKELVNNSTDKSPNVISPDSLTNPFAFADLGLPYGAGWCGTVAPGATLQLGEKEAKAVINKVFEGKGIDLQKDYFYKKDSIRVILDGFDPELNVGYIWVSQSNIGNGILKLWNVKYYDDVLAGLIVSWIDITALEDIYNERTEKKRDKAWQQHLKAAQKTTNEEEKLQAYRALYLDDEIEFIQKNKDDPNFEYVNTHLDNPNTSFDEKQKIYTRSMLITAFDDVINRYEKKDALKEILYKIVHLTDEKERRHQYNNFATFLMKNVTDEQREAQQKILANPDKAIIANEIQKFGLNYSNRQLSLREARYLGNIHKTEGDFIAMIGMQDKRFSYRTAEMIYSTEKKYEDIKREKGMEGIRAFFEEEKNREREEHAKAFENLESQVRQYVQWAKEQSGH